MGLNVIQPAVAIPRFGFKQVGVFKVFDELFPAGYFSTMEGESLLANLKAHGDDFIKADGVAIHVGMKQPKARGEKPRLTAWLRMGKQWNQKFIETHGWLGAVKDAWLGHTSIIERAVKTAKKRLQQQQKKEALAIRWF